MSLVPKDYVKFKSTRLFNQRNVPEILLDKYTTQVGVYGQIEVVQGEVKFVGLKNELGEVDKELVIKANETAITHPKYLHKLELLSPSTQFIIHYYVHKSLLKSEGKSTVQQQAAMQVNGC